MEKLETVNYLLSLLGSSPVGDLETLHPDAEVCINRLNEASRTIQKKGWWFNQEYSYFLEPDATTKEIALPTFCLEATVTNWGGVIKRGLKLYDTVNHTYQFTNSLYVNMIVKLDWELLDENAQDTIKFFAGMQLMGADLEDSIKEAAQAKLYTDAMTDMKKTNLRVQRRNILGSPASLKARAGVRPYGLRSGSIDPTNPGG